jgi:hypothetical protein
MNSSDLVLSPVNICGGFPISLSVPGIWTGAGAGGPPPGGPPPGGPPPGGPQPGKFPPGKPPAGGPLPGGLPSGGTGIPPYRVF